MCQDWIESKVNLMVALPWTDGFCNKKSEYVQQQHWIMHSCISVHSLYSITLWNQDFTSRCEASTLNHKIFDCQVQCSGTIRQHLPAPVAMVIQTDGTYALQGMHMQHLIRELDEYFSFHFHFKNLANLEQNWEQFSEKTIL